MSGTHYRVLPADVEILRELARRYLDVCNSSRNQECVRLWYKHDRCEGERPLLVCDLDGGVQMVLPDYQWRCQEPWARDQEKLLVGRLAHFEVIGNDIPHEPYVTISWQISISDYGVPYHATKPVTDGYKGSQHIDAVIEDLGREFGRLHPRQFSVDRARTLELKTLLEDVYRGLLGVEIRGNPWWSLGMGEPAIRLLGLENFMLYMYDQPENLHRLMAFLLDENIRLLDWLDREGLLTLNNRSEYIGSGSRGYTNDLPAADFGGHVRTKDMWLLLESQETVGVGPEQFDEFIFPYQNELAVRFGKVYYGCCEPLHTRWHVVKRMVNLKRVSVSPWCDQAFMAEALGKDYVFSRKPNPAMVSTNHFDEDAIRQDLRNTMQLTKKHGCTVEISMKDVHTLSGQPDRLTRWVSLARQVTAEVYG